MPIDLVPLTRRRFLAGTLAAGAGVLLGTELWGQDKEGSAGTWALLSDVHIPANAAETSKGANMTARLRQVVAEVLAWTPSLSGVIITGDCALRQGQPEDYKALLGLLNPLLQHGVEVHLALGNHDQREHFWSVWPDQKAALAPRLGHQTTLFHTASANWFILDSLETTLSPPGRLGREQLDWLAQTLDANRDKPALVLLHHNPGLDGGNVGLKDTAPLFEVIRPRRQVKAYIFGHTHNWRVQQEPSGIHLVNLPSTAYAFQEGVACGWVRAWLQKDRLQLELRCLEARHKDQGQTVELKWRA